MLLLQVRRLIRRVSCVTVPNCRKKSNQTQWNQHADHKLLNMLQKSVVLPFNPHDICWNSTSAVDLISTLSFEETVQLLHQMPPQDPRKVQLLDRALADKLRHSTGSQAVQLSTSVLQVFRSQTDDSVCYKQLLEMMPDLVESCTDHKQLIILAFMCGLNKSTGQSAIRNLRTIYQSFKEMPIVEKLSATELSILCNSLFVANITVSKATLRIVEQVLVDEINSRGLTADILPMVKIMRKAKFASDRLLRLLVKMLTETKPSESLNRGFLAHILALLADNYCYADDRMLSNLCHLLQLHVRNPIKEGFVHPTQADRAKDITRLTWALTNLRPKFDTLPGSMGPRLVDFLTREIDVRCINGEFYRNAHLAWDFLLSLACWQIYPKSIIEKILDQESISDVLRSTEWKTQSKRLSRLASFLVAAQIEAPHLHLPSGCTELIERFKVPIHRSKTKRIHLANLNNVLVQRAPLEGWQNYFYGCDLPMNIAGITFTHQGNKIAIEVLDSHVCLHGSPEPTPNRYLDLKIRLLTRQQYKVIFFTVDQLKMSSEDHLVSTIRRQIRNEN